MALTGEQASFISGARTATLGTIAEDGRPRLVPICFVLGGDVLFTPIDEKPKQTADPRSLARIRDIERRADVTVLIDRWDEDWHHLAWLRIDGRADLAEDPAERAHAIAALRAKYPQYAAHDLEHRPLIRIAIERVRSWGDLSDPGRSRSPSGGGSGLSSSPGGSRPR
jgi:PPOX class probable F420-dependent enzyme